MTRRPDVFLPLIGPITQGRGGAPSGQEPSVIETTPSLDGWWTRTPGLSRVFQGALPMVEGFQIPLSEAKLGAPQTVAVTLNRPPIAIRGNASMFARIIYSMGGFTDQLDVDFNASTVVPITASYIRVIAITERLTASAPYSTGPGNPEIYIASAIGIGGGIGNTFATRTIRWAAEEELDVAPFAWLPNVVLNGETVGTAKLAPIPKFARSVEILGLDDDIDPQSTFQVTAVDASGPILQSRLIPALTTQPMNLDQAGFACQILIDGDESQYSNDIATVFHLGL